MQIYIISLSSELLLIKTGDASLQFLLDYLSSGTAHTNDIIGHLVVGDLVFIGILNRDSVVTRIESTLSRLVFLLNDYYKPLTESAIKSDFSTVYNLIMDSNVTTINSNLLFQLYPPSSTAGLLKVFSSSLAMPVVVLGENDWRNSTVKYSVEQIWFDFEEKIRVSSYGSGLTGAVSGILKVVCNLSGNPQVILSFLNPKILIDGLIGFHRSVNVSKFQKERLLTFIPPDGEFNLMNYMIPVTKSKLPIRVKGNFRLDSECSATFDLSLSSNFDVTTDVIVMIKFPKSITSANPSLNSVGSCVFDSKSNTLTWTVGSLDISCILSLSLTLLSHTPTLISIKVEYKTKNSFSGLKISSVHCNNPGKIEKAMKSNSLYSHQFRMTL